MFRTPELRPNAVQRRMLPNVPLRLMSPDRHEVAHISAMCVPARWIIDRNAEFAFQHRDKPTAKRDRHGSADSSPTELAKMGNVGCNAHAASRATDVLAVSLRIIVGCDLPRFRVTRS